jgi:hypothetical protein
MPYLATYPCDCCSTVTEYIRQHFDPEGLTRSHEGPAAVLAIFDGCSFDEYRQFDGDGCGLTIEDVQQYLDKLREEGR